MSRYFHIYEYLKKYCEFAAPVGYERANGHQSHEMVHLKDLEWIVDLLYHYVTD